PACQRPDTHSGRGDRADRPRQVTSGHRLPGNRRPQGHDRPGEGDRRVRNTGTDPEGAPMSDDQTEKVHDLIRKTRIAMLTSSDADGRLVRKPTATPDG